MAMAVLVSALLIGLVGCGANASTDGEPEGLHATVPNVVGLTIDDAEEALTQAGYVVGQVLENASGSAAEGTVTSQSPVGGTSLPRDSEVDLTIEAATGGSE